MFDVLANRLLQLSDALEHAATDTLIGDVAEPSLDQIQPGTARRREVHVKSFCSASTSVVPSDACASRSCPRSSANPIPGRFPVDLLQELAIPGGDAAACTRRLPPPLNGCKQRRRPVPLVVVGHRAQAARINRQALLRAVQSEFGSFHRTKAPAHVPGGFKYNPTTSAIFRRIADRSRP